MKPGLKGQSINVGEDSLLTVVPEDKMRTSTMLKALQMHWIWRKHCGLYWVTSQATLLIRKRAISNEQKQLAFNNKTQLCV